MDKIVFKDKISFADMQFAINEYVNLAFIVDMATEYAYESAYSKLAKRFIVARYWTDMDIHKMSMHEYFDFAETPEIRAEIEMAMSEDSELGDFVDMCMYALENKIATHNYDISVGHKITKSLGGILNSDDLLEEIAHNKDMNDQMIALLSDAKKGKELSTDNRFAWAAKK